MNAVNVLVILLQFSVFASICFSADRNYERMRVRELKTVLADRGVSCEG